MSLSTLVNLKNELEFGKVFCPAPFIEHMLDVASPNRMCCRDKRSDLTHDEVRNRMLLGQQSPDCEFCYKQEANRAISFRQNKIKNAIKKHSLKLQQSVSQYCEQGTLPPRMVYQITSSNVCNYACIMCTPDRSSALAKKMGFVSQIKQIDISDLQIPSGAEVALAGGEPFLIKDYLDLLERMPPDVSLTITTNGSIVNEKLIALLKKFKNFYLTISIDSVGDQYQQIRVNGDWSLIEHNVEIFKSNFSNIFVETTVQKDNINHLYSVYDWTRKKDIKWKAHVLVDPAHLHWKKNNFINIDQLTQIDCQDVTTKCLLQAIVQEYSDTQK